MSAHLRVPLGGRIVEVPRAALTAELERSGPIESLALVEAIVREAPRMGAIARLGTAVEAGQPSTTTLAALLGLVRLDAVEAAPALRRGDASGPLGAATRAAALLLGGGLEELASLIAEDELVAQRTPLLLTAWPRLAVEGATLFAALLAALDRLQPGLGVTAYRALLGDVAEAVFRAVQRGGDPEHLLGPARGALVDRLAAELPGTPDLVAARAMAWLLGALAPGDDAARSAIERARTRFRDPAFHHDCAVMLGEVPGASWPPS